MTTITIKNRTYKVMMVNETNTGKNYILVYGKTLYFGDEVNGEIIISKVSNAFLSLL